MGRFFLETESEFGKAEILVSKFDNRVRVYVCDEDDDYGSGEARIFLHKKDVLRIIEYLNELVKELK